MLCVGHVVNFRPHRSKYYLARLHCPFDCSDRRFYGKHGVLNVV